MSHELKGDYFVSGMWGTDCYDWEISMSDSEYEQYQRLLNCFFDMDRADKYFPGLFKREIRWIADNEMDNRDEEEFTKTEWRNYLLENITLRLPENDDTIPMETVKETVRSLFQFAKRRLGGDYSIVNQYVTKFNRAYTTPDFDDEPVDTIEELVLSIANEMNIKNYSIEEDCDSNLSDRRYTLACWCVKKPIPGKEKEKADSEV